jgi:hypothetical protein
MNTEQNRQNQQALDNPKPGDYWHEMFCPYFLVVDVRDQAITVLSCMGGPNSLTRKNEPNARLDLDNNYWTFDLTAAMTVDREWIKTAVQYSNIPGFVADVVRGGPKFTNIITEWRDHRQKSIRAQIQQLESEWETVTGWKWLREENVN